MRRRSVDELQALTNEAMSRGNENSGAQLVEESWEQVWEVRFGSEASTNLQEMN